MWHRAKWLKVPQREIEAKRIYHGDLTGRFAYFRSQVTLPEGARLEAEITANSRYRLWINEKPVLSGPCKGDSHRQYYETVELSEYLLPGANVFCVQVLYCDPDTAEIETDERASIYGVMGQSCGHRFAMEADVKNGQGEVVATLTTGAARWRVALENTFYLKSTPITEYLGAVTEQFDIGKTPYLWKCADFDDSGWVEAEAAGDVLPTSPLYVAGVMPRFQMRQREIPLAYEQEKHFCRDFLVPSGEPAGLLKNGRLSVSGGASAEIFLDAGAIQNGYPCYRFSGGRDATVRITYFEKFGGKGSDLKRTDCQNGQVSGLTDVVRLPGGAVTYEPFWMRCFRFVRLTVETGAEGLTMEAPTFRRTGYPLAVDSKISSSEKWVGQLWEICVRTLENCMLETYMDCPYYEQLQFAMDTRLEALYTYAVTADARLAKKALIDFHYGMLPEGLTPGKYPSAYLQVLSTFSLHYIIMLWEYYQQTADIETLKLCRRDADRILDYYEDRIGPDGLVGRLGYWEFVDWQDRWQESAGMPMALMEGPSAIINLMYAYALECAAKVHGTLGCVALQEEYRQRRRELLRRVHQLCWDENRQMYREGPAFDQFTQHAQAWAVLNDLVQGEAARELLNRALADSECLKCTFCTAFEWFRALEKAGMYRQMRTCLEDWIALLELDCTTCPETPHAARSDCHAWSALPMYELVRTFAGVKNVGVAWEKVVIEPHLMGLNDLSGSVATPRGTITLAFTSDCYRLTIPVGMEAVFRTESGENTTLTGGTYAFSR